MFNRSQDSDYYLYERSEGRDMFIGCVENSWDEVCLTEDSVLQECPVAMRCGLSLLYADSFKNEETNEEDVFLHCTDIICS
jgi:hypothetical protein